MYLCKEFLNRYCTIIDCVKVFYEQHICSQKVLCSKFESGPSRYIVVGGTVGGANDRYHDGGSFGSRAFGCSVVIVFYHNQCDDDRHGNSYGSYSFGGCPICSK